jgi:hypothetical protein
VNRRGRIVASATSATERFFSFTISKRPTLSAIPQYVTLPSALFVGRFATVRIWLSTLRNPQAAGRISQAATHDPMQLITTGEGAISWLTL